MRTIPDPGFADDDGAAPPELVAALTAYAEEPDARYRATLALLQRARLLVPVVAVLGELEETEHGGEHDGGLTHEKTSDMATVLMQGADGRMALLAFTGTATLTCWNPAARPVAVTATTAARAAVQDGAAALVVDVAGPVIFVVEQADLTAMAGGETLVRVGDRWGWARPEA